jgi:sulfhydrogenase subunit alpha
MAHKTIKVDYLARVEGEGAFKVVVRDRVVQSAQLSIFEPPRFFEAFLRGRACSEAPDITSRICGICPIAYQMSALHAMENALGVAVTGPLRELRRLVYCGEWIESHTLHIYMLHAPDFLGYASAIEMAREHGDAVRRGLMLKKAGNEIVSLIGGREIHPINIRLGGFYRTPRRRELAPLAERLTWARDAALETVRWTASFDFPDRERDYEFVALRHANEYPFNEGHIVSNRGLDILPSAYDDHFEESHVERSTALYSRIRTRGSYLCGPLARYNLNFDRLSPVARRGAERRPRRHLHQPLSQHCHTRNRGALRLRRGAQNYRRLRGAGAASYHDRAARRLRLRRDRGATRPPLSPLSLGSGRHHRGRENCTADLTESVEHRGGP